MKLSLMSPRNLLLRCTNRRRTQEACDTTVAKYTLLFIDLSLTNAGHYASYLSLLLVYASPTLSREFTHDAPAYLTSSFEHAFLNLKLCPVISASQAK